MANAYDIFPSTKNRECEDNTKIIDNLYPYTVVNFSDIPNNLSYISQIAELVNIKIFNDNMDKYNIQTLIIVYLTCYFCNKTNKIDLNKLTNLIYDWNIKNSNDNNFIVIFVTG